MIQEIIRRNRNFCFIQAILGYRPESAKSIPPVRFGQIVHQAFPPHQQAIVSIFTGVGSGFEDDKGRYCKQDATILPALQLPPLSQVILWSGQSKKL